ncbi:Permease of the drug/metabolite transporter (DMT) superfamily [Chitinophaga costaii]|uniref:Permease of the drug/metabolite transporter (DMT) superfamily n=1 Tax=Chitinophaga costaii TaxID=1335309 RepID=A0A1C3YWI9_9BACT|nr:EamA family transporter [Chitinophaga costaii]PUZ30129.1 EamA family transporter [Chitinophaga costaii]SCB74382.1 Permease of the drug/metabolite transporter (DMT) superfamily [Chitinophaga costaii]
MQQTSKTPAYLALGLVSILWGTTFLAAHIWVRHLHGIMLSGVRMAIAGALLTGYFLLRGEKLPNKGLLGRIFIIGLLMLFGSNGMLTWSLAYIPSGLGAIMAATVPMWVTLFSLLLVKRVRLAPMLIIGLVAGLMGVVGIFFNYLPQLLNPDFRFGIFLSFISCLCWALGSVLTAKWALPINYLYGAGLQMLLGGVVMVITCVCTGIYRPHNGLTIDLWESLLYLIFIGSVLTYSAYVFALNNLPPSLAAVYAYINPIVAVLLGWVILDETFTWLMGVCGLVTIGGVYLVNRSFSKAKSYERA